MVLKKNPFVYINYNKHPQKQTKMEEKPIASYPYQAIQETINAEQCQLSAHFIEMVMVILMIYHFRRKNLWICEINNDTSFHRDFFWNADTFSRVDTYFLITQY